MLTAEKLREVLRYDAETGLFYRRKHAKRYASDEPCGHLTDRGYVGLSVFGRAYRAHRLAWLYVHGEWPTAEMDHVNGIKTDNRIANLRCCTRSENGRNRRLYKNNKLSAKGVYWWTEKKKYSAAIKVNGKKKSLGTFDTVDEAAHAYNKAVIAHFGEFAVLNPIGTDKAGPADNQTKGE